MMNREIKFRAWDKRNKEMIDFEDREYDDLDAWIDNPDIYETMQFTGLKDKNGKEIYEGDIVKYYIEGVEVANEERGIDKRFGPKTMVIDKPLIKTDLCDRRYAWKIRTDFEVIGNIYENPELLQGNQRSEYKLITSKHEK